MYPVQVPNIDDVGRWLRPEEGSHSSDTASFEISQLGSAKVFSFGDEFRPCQLKRVIVPYPFKPGSNAFKNVKTYEFKVYNLLVEHGVGKPALIFAPTRNGQYAGGHSWIRQVRSLTRVLCLSKARSRALSSLSRSTKRLPSARSDFRGRTRQSQSCKPCAT